MTLPRASNLLSQLFGFNSLRATCPHCFVGTLAAESVRDAIRDTEAIEAEWTPTPEWQRPWHQSPWLKDQAA